jgi:hypothetical protein
MNARPASRCFNSAQASSPNSSTSSPSQRSISPFTLAVLAVGCYLTGAAFFVGSHMLQEQQRDLAGAWGQDHPEDVRAAQLLEARRAAPAALVSRKAPSAETAPRASRATNTLGANAWSANGVYISDAGSPVDGRVYPNPPTGRTHREPQRGT